MTTLDDLARRLVTRAPAGAPDGAQPPAGAVLATHTPAGEHRAAAGSRSLHPAEPMTLDTVHDLASVTKVAATTATLMALVSRGDLTLDRPVRDLLPAFSGGGKDEVTVRDLLAHRSGMQPWWPIYAAVQHDPSVAAACDVVDRLPLLGPPGSAHRYSDLGFIQLGRVISAVTGLALPDAASTLVFEPLGVDLGYGPRAGAPVADSAPDDRIEQEMLDSGIPYRVPFSAADFRGWRTGPVRGQVHDGNAFHALAGVGGHAGLFGTVPELLRLTVALAHARDHTSIWAPRVVAEFRTAPSAEHHAGPWSWRQALGFRRYTMLRDGHGVDVLGHTGFVGAAMAFVPDGDVAVALGTNRLLRAGPPVPTELMLAELLSAATGPQISSTVAPPSVEVSRA